MGEDEVAQALVAGRLADEAEDDEERHGGDDLGHHEGLVDRGVDRGAAAEGALADGAERGEGRDGGGDDRGEGWR
jgi:hypothetical protein